MNTYYRDEIIESGRNRIGFGTESLPAETLRELIDSPETPLYDPNSITVKSGKTALVVRALLPGKDGPLWVAYKRIKRKTLWKRVTSFVQTNRAFHNWQIGNWCLEHGISTPNPVAAIVPRRAVADRNSYLLTQWIEQADDLHRYLDELENQTEKERKNRVRVLAITLGTLLGKMHRHGMSHRDLKAGNFLVVEQTDSLQVFLIDLDGARLHRHLEFERIIRNLSRLGLAVSPFRSLSAANLLRFLKSYMEESEIPFVEWRTWWGAIQRGIAHRVAEKRKRAA